MTPSPFGNMPIGSAWAGVCNHDSDKTSIDKMAVPSRVLFIVLLMFFIGHALSRSKTLYYINYLSQLIKYNTIHSNKKQKTDFIFKVLFEITEPKL